MVLSTLTSVVLMAWRCDYLFLVCSIYNDVASPPCCVKVGRRRRRKPSRTASQVVEDLSSRSGPLSAEEEARLMRAQVRVRACGCVRAGLWYNLGMRPRARSHTQEVYPSFVSVSERRQWWTLAREAGG